MNRGLFRRAIVQSGALDAGIARYPLLAEAERAGEDFLEYLGVKTIAQARSLSARELNAKTQAYRAWRWGPVIDGDFLPGTPAEILAAHRENDVELMAGDTPDEVKGLRPVKSWEQFRGKMAPVYGAWWPELDELTHVRSAEELEAYYRSAGFNTFEIGNRYAASKRFEEGRQTYLYRFCPHIPGDDAGAFHSSDLWFVFETLSKCWRPFRGAHYDLARRMCDYWTNFARTGDPNGTDDDGTPLPLWRPSAGEAWNVMLLKEETVCVREEPDPCLTLEMKRLDAASGRFRGRGER